MNLVAKQDVLQVQRAIIREVVDLSGLVSLTFVGSTAPSLFRHFRPSRTADIDTVIVFQQLSADRFRSCRLALTRVAKAFGTGATVVHPVFRHAPFTRTRFSQGCTLFLHGLVVDVETVNSGCPAVLSAWVEYEPQVGTPLRDVIDRGALTKKRILASRYGPVHCLDVIARRRLLVRLQVVRNNKIREVTKWERLGRDDLIEFSFYSATKCGRTLARLLGCRASEIDREVVRYCLRSPQLKSFGLELRDVLHDKEAWYDGRRSDQRRVRQNVSRLASQVGGLLRAAIHILK